MVKAAPVQEKAEELQKQLLQHYQNKPETHDEWWEKELARMHEEIDRLKDDIEEICNPRAFAGHADQWGRKARHGLRGPHRGLRGLAQGERGGPAAAAAAAPWCIPCRRRWFPLSGERRWLGCGCARRRDCIPLSGET
jgi:hypothetical protein